MITVSNINPINHWILRGYFQSLMAFPALNSFICMVLSQRAENYRESAGDLPCICTNKTRVPLYGLGKPVPMSGPLQDRLPIFHDIPFFLLDAPFVCFICLWTSSMVYYFPIVSHHSSDQQNYPVSNEPSLPTFSVWRLCFPHTFTKQQPLIPKNVAKKPFDSH